MRIKELFTVPEGQKVTEKVFGKVLISSICSILLCMACLVSTTWAWFSLDISSNNNSIQIGQFAVNVTVANAEKVTTDTGSYQYRLAAGQYEVIINAAGSTASGHCIVTLAGQPYETIRIGGEGNPSEVRFMVTITENEIVLTDTTPDQTDENAADDAGAEPILLTITPVWGAPEGNGGLGSTGVSTLTAEIDVFVLPEPEETTVPEETTEPTTTPTEPTTTPTEPTMTPTEPTTTPTEPTTTPTEPTTTPTEPTTTPTEPETTPTTETTPVPAEETPT